MNQSERRELLIERKTGRRRAVVGAAPSLSSAGTPWRGYLLEEHSLSGFEVSDVVCPNHLVILQLRSEVSIEWRTDGAWRTTRLRPGHVSVMPAGTSHSVRYRAPFVCMIFSLTPGFLAQAVTAKGERGVTELRPRFGSDDPLAAQLLSALRAEAAAGAPGGRRYAESLATALASHLARHFGARPVTAALPLDVERPELRRVLAHIEAQPEGDLSVPVLAGVGGLSPWYFSRLFKRATGKTPHAYVMGRQLARARELLAGELPLADIAQRLRFCDQSHFAAQFRRAFGVTPLRFRIELRDRQS